MTRAGEMLPSVDFGLVQRQHLVEWCAAENDYNPLHFDPVVAAEAGFPSPPVQGTLRLALMGRLVERWMPQGWRLASFTVAYPRPLLEGAHLTIGGEVVEWDAAVGIVTLHVTDEAGTVGAEGTAVLAPIGAEAAA